MLKIIDTKCEYCENPLGIDCEKPRFFWKVDADGEKQVSYRVLVASDKALLDKGEGDLFDTGFVVADGDFYAQYEGRPLVSRERGWWKVFVRGERVCAESETNFFETGLLRDSDWKGTWMGMPVANQGGTVLFRKVIPVADKTPVAARAYVCAIGYQETFFNGVKLGGAVLDPALTEYEERVFYRTYDLMPLLRVGDNVFGAEVGHGWYGARKALVQIYIDYADGSTDEFHSSVNGGWWVGGSPTVENSVYDGEVYDARIEDKVPKNWASTDYEPTWERGWMFTIYTAPPRGKLEAQNVEAIEITEKFPALSVTERTDGAKIVDIGRNIAGWARVRVSGKRGDKITLKYGERLTADGDVDRCNLRSARASDTYILRGEGEEEYAPRFTYHGFQYIRIETTGDCRLLSVIGEHVHTATRPAGEFFCSDDALNRLHENAVITELNNQHGILTDCPQRDERFGWLNDLGSRLYQTVYNCGMERFFPKITRDIRHTQREDGAIGDTAPYYTGGRPADPVSIAYLLMPVLCYTYYGDKRCAREAYDGCKAWTDYLLSQSDGYIMRYSYYGDWVEPDPGRVHSDNIFVSTAYLYWHLRLTAKLAAIVGRENDERLYASHAEKCASAIGKKYFDRGKCVYAGGTQAENSIALSLGLVPEDLHANVAANVAANVVASGYHSTCGNVGYRHMFYALCDYGYADVFLRMLKNPEYPGWGYMLANGATSVWERWESEMSDVMDSFDHPMFGSYDACFYRYLAGIRVDEDAFGCDKITIEPVLATGMKSVRATFDTVRGKISVGWEKTENEAILRVSLPPSVSAKIVFGGEAFRRGGKHIFRIPFTEEKQKTSD